MLKAYSGFLVRHACALASLLFASAWVSGGLLLLLGRTHFQNYGAFELLVRGAPAVDEMDLANAALKAADAWAAGSRARPRTVLSSLDSAEHRVFHRVAEELAGYNATLQLGRASVARGTSGASVYLVPAANGSRDLADAPGRGPQLVHKGIK